MKKTPITLFADDEVNEKLQEKLERLGMDKSEYISSLILNDSDEEEEFPEEEEDEPEDEEEILSGMETSSSSEDITEKNDLIALLEERNQELKRKLAEYEDCQILNQLFDVLEGHTLEIRSERRVYKINSKADFLKCLVHTYYVNFDPTKFGLDEDEFFGEDN